MKRISDFLLIIIACLPLLISSYFFFLTDPPIWPDEPVFYETAQNLLQTGLIFTNINGDISKITGQVGYGYPPLYFYLQGLYTAIFGHSIEAIRSLSLIAGLISLIIFFNLLKILFNRQLAFLGTVLLAFNIHFARASRLGRMEIFTLLFLILSIYLFYLAQKHHKLWLLIISSFSAVLSFLIHPLGAMASIFYLFNLLISNFSFKTKMLAFLSWLGFLTLAIYFWVSKISSGLIMLISSYQVHLANKGLKIPYAFSLWQKETAWWFLFLICLVIILLSSLLALKIRNKITVGTLLMTLIALIIALAAKEGGYLIFPLTLIILSLMTILFYQNKSLFFYRSALVCFFLLIVGFINIQYFNNDNIGINNKHNHSLSANAHFDYHSFTKLLKEKMPADQKLTIFISAVPDPYFDLKENRNWSFLEAVDPNLPFDKADYQKTLDQVDYVILTWYPQDFLKEYLEKHTTEIIPIRQNSGYSALLIKLKTNEENNN